MLVHSEYRFEAAHSLDHLPEGHKCKRLHGHSYRFIVYVGGPLDPAMGWIIDYADIDAAVKPLVVDALDHRNVNEFVPVSTAENLVRWMWQRLRAALPGLARIELWETAKNGVTYEGEDHA